MNPYQDDFNILNETEGKPVPSDTIIGGPNLQKVAKMTPRKLANSILNVYEELGGDAWLMTQAVIDPKGFMDLLKKILPNNIKLDGLENLSIRLVDRYGRDLVERPQRPTSALEAPSVPGPTTSALPDIAIRDRYEISAATPQAEDSDPEGSEILDFDFS